MAIPNEKKIYTAISPYEDFCDGFMSPGAQGIGYVNTLKVSAASVRELTLPDIEPEDKKLAHRDFGLNSITSFDQAETQDNYIGQINMITASSFSGIGGSVWGYDLAYNTRFDTLEPFAVMEQYDGSQMELYDAAPLFEAAEALYGTYDNRKYPPLPGGHIICADKSVSASYPTDVNNLQDDEGFAVWAMLSLSLANNRDQDASCFIEDFGIWKNQNPTDAELVEYLDEHRKQIAKCTIACGQHNKVTYKKSFIGYAYAIIKPGEIGTALNAAPYITLAQKALQKGSFEMLKQITLNEWLEEHPNF